MANLLSRITAGVRRGVEVLLAPAEAPRETTPDAGDQQRALLARLQQARVDQAALKHLLETRAAQVRDSLPALERQAQTALRANQEGLARLALQQRYLAQQEAAALGKQIDEVQQEEQRLLLVEQRLTAHLEILRARQAVVAVRYTTAQAQVALHETFGDVSEDMSELGQALERAEQRAEHMQARASALDQLAGAGALGLGTWPAADALSEPLDEHDLAQAVDQQLRALKAGLT